ncbi:hypothetical protein [Desulfatitalea alkaliphila]|uniref:Calcineurin-like phosphoesterase domain-containing protein n=1 Tax=Desulfatitalea alkaliphila TaxID=2929485 RepID=A0AA41R031_9BACT|nr:hypothetical protein [Desulfatitalea alkaliphila]MCJ8499389.1 hypothetical protein [Desulfatitalea alkaliphila]
MGQMTGLRTVPPRTVACVLLILAALLLVPLGQPASAQETAPPKPMRRVVVVATNDLRGQLLPCAYCGDITFGGLPRRAAFLQTLRASAGETLAPMPFILIENGDLLAPGQEFPDLHAELLVSALNRMGYDLFSIGAVDLRGGPNHLRKLADMAEFPLLGANVNPQVADSQLQPLAFKTMDGVRVAFIGWIDPESIIRTASSPTLPDGAALQELVAEARTEADIVILSAHMRLSRIKALLRVVPGIDLAILSHHRQTYHGRIEGGPLVISPGWKGEKVAVIQLSWDPASKRVAAMDYALHTLDRTIADDPGMLQTISAFNAELDGARQGEKTRQAMVKDMVENARHMSPEEFFRAYGLSLDNTPPMQR